MIVPARLTERLQAHAFADLPTGGVGSSERQQAALASHQDPSRHRDNQDRSDSNRLPEGEAAVDQRGHATGSPRRGGTVIEQEAAIVQADAASRGITMSPSSRTTTDAISSCW